MEHGMQHPRTLICHMHIILHTCNSKTCKVYSMEQFHNTSDSRVKGTRGVTLSYIWADIPDIHCRRPSVARELVNPMFFFNVYGLIASGQKWPTFSGGGGVGHFPKVSQSPLAKMPFCQAQGKWLQAPVPVPLSVSSYLQWVMRSHLCFSEL